MQGNNHGNWTSTNVDDGYYRAFLNFENAGMECYANLQKGELDCFGAIGGSAVVDECGVCGGDGSTCDE